MGVCQLIAVTYARTHHNSTVAAEAQVPGPKGSRPIPKNVAKSQAGVEAAERCLADVVLIFALGAAVIGRLLLLRCAVVVGGAMLRILEIHFIWVGERGGNDVAAACPFAEIDETAAFTAKGELRIGTQNEFLTGGTAKT
jgi:hypothetical protein